MKQGLALGLMIMLLLCAAATATAEGTVGYAIEEIGLSTAFPSGWQVVTPDSVSQHFKYFSESTPESAAENMRTEGVYAVAFSPSGDAALRVLARTGDATQTQYHDIERYSAAMRSAIKNDFMDKAAWALTGYRYSEAEWTNKEGTGRVLNLIYTIRFGEDTVGRGRQVYTIRNGLAITLDLQVTGSRKLTADEEKIFDAFVRDTVFPESVNYPLFPVGLDLTTTVPEETVKADISIKGETTKGATITATLLPEEGDPTQAGQVTANNSGKFTLEFTLPYEGEWRLMLAAELEGYSPMDAGYWISYNQRVLPVTFTSRPEGDVYDSQIEITGKTISGVTIQCMEGDANKKVTTGSDGKFSFKVDRGITGTRTVVLSFTKKGYDNRRFDITFNRKWEREDYIKYLSDKVQSLSYQNLSENAEKYLGRMVKYSGEVLDISTVADRTYVQLGLKQEKDGTWTERIIAVTDGQDILLNTGDKTSLYIEVTGETYAFSGVTSEGDAVDIDLPSVRLLTYAKE